MSRPPAHGDQLEATATNLRNRSAEALRTLAGAFDTLALDAPSCGMSGRRLREFQQRLTEDAALLRSVVDVIQPASPTPFRP